MYEDSSREKETNKRKVAKENYQEKKACSRNVIHSPFTRSVVPLIGKSGLRLERHGDTWYRAPAACCF